MRRARRLSLAGLAIAAGAGAAIAGGASLSDSERAALVSGLASPSGLTREQALETLSRDVCEDEQPSFVDAALERATTPAARRALLGRLRSAFAGPPSIAALAHLATTGDLATRLAALEAVGRLGPGGVPALDAVLANAREPDLRLQVAAARALVYQNPPPQAAVVPMGELLRTPDQELRRAALEVLVSVADPKAATAGLIAVVTDAGADQTSRLLAIRTLGRTASPEAIAPLAALLDDADLSWRRVAADALADLARKLRRPALERPLRHAADDLDRQVKVAGVAGLARLGELREALPTLRRLLWTHDRDAQSAAIALAGELGPAAAPAAREIVELVLMPSEALIESMQSDGREERRQDAEKVLAKLGRGALPPIARYLDSRNSEVREEGMRALGFLPAKDAAPLAGRVKRLLGDPSDQVRESAIGLLATIAPRPAEATAAITPKLTDRSPVVRRRAVAALGNLGAAAAPAIARLADALADKDAEVAVAAANALGNFGTRARSAGPALGHAAGDPRGAVRMAAAEALVQTAADETKGLALLIEAFDPASPASPASPPWEPHKRDAPVASPDDAGQRLAAIVGPRTPTAALLPIATKLLAGTDWSRRRSAMQILDRLQLAAAPALPAMAAQLGNRQVSGLEATLCQAIGRFGAAARPYAPQLLETFKRTRSKPCGDALVPIGRASPDLVPLIQTAFRNDCPRPYGPANDLLATIAAP